MKVIFLLIIQILLQNKHIHTTDKEIYEANASTSKTSFYEMLEVKVM